MVQYRPGRLIGQGRVILMRGRVDDMVFVGFVRQPCEQQTSENDDVVVCRSAKLIEVEWILISTDCGCG